MLKDQKEHMANISGDGERGGGSIQFSSTYAFHSGTRNRHCFSCRTVAFRKIFVYRPETFPDVLLFTLFSSSKGRLVLTSPPEQYSRFMHNWG